MKLIISRKGVDSTAGGFPSPILPDGTMFSIPIPESGTGRVKYADLRLAGHELGEVVSALSRRKSREGYDGSTVVHHDPDLVQSARKRPEGCAVCSRVGVLAGTSLVDANGTACQGPAMSFVFSQVRTAALTGERQFLGFACQQRLSGGDSCSASLWRRCARPAHWPLLVQGEERFRLASDFNGSDDEEEGDEPSAWEQRDPSATPG